MPFADKFRAMMDFPFAGDTVEGFAVARVDVGHESSGAGHYKYSVRMEMHGAGGRQGVRRALKALFSSHPMTFSGYGNPYQLWFGKPDIDSLGDQRYLVTIEGAGSRVFLAEELARFLEYLHEEGELANLPDEGAQQALVEGYLGEYLAHVRRKVDRYRRRLRKAERAGP